MRYLNAMSLGGEQRGLSIIELMIALVLASLLSLGLVQIFVSNSQAFRLNEASARTQEYGRIASEILGREARGAGYFGCNSESVKNNLDPTDEDYEPEAHDFDQATPVSARPANRPGAALAGTHFIRFSGMDGAGTEISTLGPATSASFKVNNTPNRVERGEVIAISDCSGTDIFQISNVVQGAGGTEISVVANSGEDAPGNDFTDNGCTNCLANNYGTGSQILRPYNRSYFIGTSNVTGAPALMRLTYAPDGSEIVTEMVEGVIDMRVRAGTSNSPDNAVNQWTEATAGPNWANTRAVEVSLLVRGGENNLFDGAQTLCFPAWADCAAGDNFVAPDTRMYRDYTFVMNVRNSTE